MSVKRLATAAQITELANAVANHAEAIANRTSSADINAVARLLLDNAKTLVQWTMTDETE
jgi:CO dehydrogenase nickel-insertion accessory protein CooC1